MSFWVSGVSPLAVFHGRGCDVKLHGATPRGQNHRAFHDVLELPIPLP
jgi:hypothetical protein